MPMIATSTASARRAVLLVLALLPACGVPAPRPSRVSDRVDPHANDQALVIKIAAPSERTLPDAPNVGVAVEAYCTSGNGCTTGAPLYRLPTAGLAPSETVTKQLPLAMDSGFEVRLNFQRGAALSYLYLDGAIKHAVEVSTVQLRRIDVETMDVTRPDGSHYRAAGQATIAVTSGSNPNLRIAELQTGYGMDVISGFVYRVDVTASTEVGPQAYSATLDFTR